MIAGYLSATTPIFLNATEVSPIPIIIARLPYTIYGAETRNQKVGIPEKKYASRELSHARIVFTISKRNR